MTKIQIKIQIKKETKTNVTFYLYISNSQTLMTLSQQDFAALCGLLTKGQVGMPLDKIEFDNNCIFEWLDNGGGK